ncbi:MAG: hypothetical protein M3O61_03335 [Gemmatimonadota bacterium]|nr:hypothetical protein [Gemmatimonadota bacterium]
MISCKQWIQAERRECHRWILIVHIRGGGNLVVDVSLEELRDLEQLATPAEMLDYLEIFQDAPSPPAGSDPPGIQGPGTGLPRGRRSRSRVV